MKKIIILFCFIIIPNIGYSETVTFQCVYPTHARLDEEKGAVVGKEDFSLMFLLDLEASKAYMIGSEGSDEVIFLRQAAGFTLIETTGTGNVMTTTISNGMDSVHSRHPIIPAGETAKIIASQYYGFCSLK